MKNILENVRLDAISKLKSEKVGQSQLADAVSSIMELSTTAQNKGLFALEEAVENVSSDFLKKLIMLVVDGTDPAAVVEIATNEYWTNALEGTQAMMDYMYLRGMLGIQSGENSRTLEEILLSLMPLEQQKEYKLRRNSAKRQFAIMSRTEIEEKFAAGSPSFEDRDVLERVSSLEKQICLLPDRSIQRLLRDVDDRVLAVCAYAFKEETRWRILDQLSQRRVNTIVEEIVCSTLTSQEEVSESIKKVYFVISELQKDGDIHVVDVE